MSQLVQTMGALISAGDARCAHQIAWVQADTLIARDLAWMNRGQHWLQTVRSSPFSDMQPGIVVLGLGPHCAPQLGFEDAISYYVGAMEQIVKDISQLRMERPDIHIVWKTITPGHPSKLAGVPDSPLQNSSYFADGSLGWRFNHRFFPAMDAIALTALKDTSVAIMDASPLYLRADGHPRIHKDKSGMHPFYKNMTDILHYCANGPLDFLAESLFNTMQHLPPPPPPSPPAPGAT